MPRHARRRQGTRDVLARAIVRVGFPASDTERAVGALACLAGSSRRLVEISSPSLPYPMPNKQPSFAERCRALRDAADDLKAIADTVALEAMRMAAAEKRFAERRGQKPERRARE